MTKKDVQVGSTYVAMVSGKLARVRITEEIERQTSYRPPRFMTSWRAVNVDTGREITVKSAARLRRLSQS